MSDTDLQLLARYTRQHTDEAFAELVRRHLGLVYSAALRQVRSPELAEEVAQSVFTDLARQARRLAPGTILTAWLYQVTRRTAVDFVRREVRRQLREHIASEMNAMNAASTDWTQIEPLLDEAVHALEETDRAAVLLRYFENKSLREVGQTLGTSEDAAQKRVSRAVERLREFFARRGIPVGASGLVVAISANAVQAAPSALITALTTAAFAGTTLTPTAAIAMTTLQKTFLAATFVAALGTGIYEAREAASLRTQLQTFQQQAPLAAELQQLTRDREALTAQLEALRAENDRLNRNAAELLKLRAEVTRWRADAQELAQFKAGRSNDATESAAKSWVSRVNQLKQRLDQWPDKRIPELQFATEQDWLDAAKDKLDTESDYRQALSTLRTGAERKFASSLLQPALKQYMEANNGKFPEQLSQLQPYFKSPLDEAILRRWEVASADTVKSLMLGGDVIITQKAPVDDVYDTRFGIGPHGFGSTDFLSSLTRETMAAVNNAFRAANNGQWPADVSQLLPYAVTPEQQEAVQKLIQKKAAQK